MQVNQITLGRLLDSSVQYQIPLFQRPYSWKEKNWQDLWDDLMNLYNEQVQGSHFLGPIVTQSLPGMPGSISPYLVIDGQQRLTTLSILLAVLRNHLKKIPPKINAEQIQGKYLTNQYEDKDKDSFYKVLPTQSDREIYQSIIQAKPAKNIKKEGLIYKTYKFFDNLLTKTKTEQDTLLDYVKLKNIIIDQLTIVNITTDDRDNPYLIFESLNHKGEELTQVDLVRNYIFMRLDAEEMQNVYHNDWLPFINSFEKSCGNQAYALELTKAFWFYLRKDGKEVTEKEVYQTIKKHFDNSLNDVKYELEKLLKFAKYYQRFSFPDDEPEPRLKKWFIRLKRLDFTTCYIFLLNIYYEYEAERLSIEQFEKILLYLESYFVRRLFAKVPTNSLGKIFNNLHHEVKTANSHNLVDGLCQVLRSYDKSKIWPQDDVFRNGIINCSIYTPSQIDRTKLILEILESSFSKEKITTDNLSVEHIMPQKLKPEWKAMLGTNHDYVHKKWLHTLGNLTLTGYNSEMSNRPFSEKLSYFQSSNISLNQYFRNIDVWNEEAIRSRAESLADIAIKIWPR